MRLQFRRGLSKVTDLKKHTDTHLVKQVFTSVESEIQCTELFLCQVWPCLCVQQEREKLLGETQEKEEKLKKEMEAKEALTAKIKVSVF